MTRSKQTRQAQRGRRLIAQTFIALSNNDVNAVEILQFVPQHLRRMRVFDVVRRFPHMGGDGADKVLKRAKVWPTTRMGNLSNEEKERIISALPPRVKKE